MKFTNFNLSVIISYSQFVSVLRREYHYTQYWYAKQEQCYTIAIAEVVVTANATVKIIMVVQLQYTLMVVQLPLPTLIDFLYCSCVVCTSIFTASGTNTQHNTYVQNIFKAPNAIQYSTLSHQGPAKKARPAGSHSLH